MTENKFLSDDELEQAAGGQNSVIPGKKSPYTVHVVRFGDTLSAMAVKYGSTVAEIVRLNNLPNPDCIKVGQEILVPNNK